MTTTYDWQDVPDKERFTLPEGVTGVHPGTFTPDDGGTLAATNPTAGGWNVTEPTVSEQAAALMLMQTRADLTAARARIAELEGSLNAIGGRLKRERETLSNEAAKERELREATQEDVDSLNGVVARLEKRCAKLEDWQRRAVDELRSPCPRCRDHEDYCSQCLRINALLSEVEP